MAVDEEEDPVGGAWPKRVRGEVLDTRGAAVGQGVTLALFPIECGVEIRLEPVENRPEPVPRRERRVNVQCQGEIRPRP